MNIHTMMIEAELKAQLFAEQADHARQVRRAQRHQIWSAYKTAVQFVTACQAGWAAYRDSMRTTRHHMA